MLGLPPVDFGTGGELVGSGFQMKTVPSPLAVRNRQQALDAILNSTSGTFPSMAFGVFLKRVFSHQGMSSRSHPPRLQRGGVRILKEPVLRAGVAKFSASLTLTLECRNRRQISLAFEFILDLFFRGVTGRWWWWCPRYRFSLPLWRFRFDSFEQLAKTVVSSLDGICGVHEPVG